MYCMYAKHQIPHTCLVMHSSCHALVAHIIILHPVLPLRGLSFDQMSVPCTLYSSSLSIDQIFVGDWADRLDISGDNVISAVKNNLITRRGESPRSSWLYIECGVALVRSSVFFLCVSR